MTTVGILGGGQLGWMLSESLLKHGATPIVLSNGPSPAIDRVVGTLPGPWDDPFALAEFEECCDVVTIDVEHVPTIALDTLSEKLVPSAEVIKLTQHRIREKRFLAKHGLPHAAFETAESVDEARALASELTFPAIVKTALGGYDGRGQFRVGSIDDYLNVVDELDYAIDTFGIVIEEPLEIVAEASVVVARDGTTSVAFPIFENTHENHILDITTLPSSLPHALETRMIGLAKRAADAMDVRGLLTTEFFLTRKPGRAGGDAIDGYWLFFNEFAPRPHNSGHITRNACTLSQFDLLARTLLGIPLSEPELLPGAWGMANLLSDLWANSTQDLDFAAACAAHPELVDIVLYGKRPTRQGRKMGHVISRGASIDDVRASLHAFRRELDRR